MWLITVAAALGVVGFVSAILMGVTVVGVCRYGDRYARFFTRFTALSMLAKIKEMAGIYLRILNAFVGREVGFKHEGLVPKNKFFGLYIEHLLLIYWFIGTILVLSFRPIEPVGEHTNSLLQAGAFFALLSINVLSDAASILWTKRCIALLATPAVPVSIGRLFVILLQDILVAVALMFVVQLISNGLYAIQIGRTDAIFSYMFDWRTAFRLYAPVDPTFSNWRFAGQLVITCSTYIPSLLFYLICLVILFLKPFHSLLSLILSLMNVDTTNRRRRNCNPVTYVSSLAGISGFALLSMKLLLDAIR
jgi:hypothetical protein